MKKNTLTKTNKPSPFIAPGSLNKITPAEIELRKQKIKKAEEIGASITRFDTDSDVENPYRVKALIYINKGMDIPEELKDKIKKFDEQHKYKTTT